MFNVALVPDYHVGLAVRIDVISSSQFVPCVIFYPLKSTAIYF